MKEEIKIPAMGESVSEATIGTFLKPSGAAVNEGEELVELETEKVNQVLYAPITGVVVWTVQESDNVTIGQVIGSVESDAHVAIPVKQEEITLSPLLDKPIVAHDVIVEPLPSSTLSSKKGESRRKITTMRQTIAKRLVNALHSTAMLTTFNEVDMSAVMALRAKYQESFLEKQGVKLGFMSFFVKAVVEGLKMFPDFNSYIDGEEIVTHETYDIGIAVGTDKGLIVPVIRQCEQKSFAEIEKDIIDFAQKARNGKIAIADLEGGGFTITNGGIYGSMLSTPILNPPQSGILGMHKIMKRPVVQDDDIVIRPMMYLALSYDHRIVDGKEAVSFLIHIKEILEDPARLILFADKFFLMNH